jgi:hypothetical protein
LAYPAPEGKPFPHLDDAEIFRGRIRRMRKLSVAVPAAPAPAGIAVMLSRAYGSMGEEVPPLRARRERGTAAPSIIT